jgi:hypothetical protein
MPLFKPRRPLPETSLLPPPDQTDKQTQQQKQQTQQQKSQPNGRSNGQQNSKKTAAIPPPQVGVTCLELF